MAGINDLFTNRFMDGALRVEAELDRAHRLLLSLNNPDDRGSIERYIAELEALQCLDLGRRRQAS